MGHGKRNNVKEQKEEIKMRKKDYENKLRFLQRMPRNTLTIIITFFLSVVLWHSMEESAASKNILHHTQSPLLILGKKDIDGYFKICEVCISVQQNISLSFIFTTHLLFLLLLLLLSPLFLLHLSPDLHFPPFSLCVYICVYVCMCLCVLSVKLCVCVSNLSPLLTHFTRPSHPSLSTLPCYKSWKRETSRPPRINRREKNTYTSVEKRRGGCATGSSSHSATKHTNSFSVLGGGGSSWCCRRYQVELECY